MLKITGQPKGEIEVKRFYLEGIEIEVICPNCSNKKKWNDYLSYPDINIPTNLPCYCNECEHEWGETIILKVSLEIPID